MTLPPTGTTEAVNPGLTLSSDATSATAGFTFDIADTYKVCYKVDGGSYVQVGTSLLTTVGVPPTRFADDGKVLFGENATEYITLHGGSGQNVA